MPEESGNDDFFVLSVFEMYFQTGDQEICFHIPTDFAVFVHSIGAVKHRLKRLQASRSEVAVCFPRIWRKYPVKWLHGIGFASPAAVEQRHFFRKTFRKAV